MSSSPPHSNSSKILHCPWHSWEFDITTGRSIFNPHKVRVKTYEVSVETCHQSTLQGVEKDPTVETFSVTLEGELVVLHA